MLIDPVLDLYLIISLPVNIAFAIAIAIHLGCSITDEIILASRVQSSGSCSGPVAQASWGPRNRLA